MKLTVSMHAFFFSSLETKTLIQNHCLYLSEAPVPVDSKKVFAGEIFLLQSEQLGPY